MGKPKTKPKRKISIKFYVLTATILAILEFVALDILFGSIDLAMAMPIKIALFVGVQVFQAIVGFYITRG